MEQQGLVKLDGLKSFLDDLLHPGHKPEEDDPGRPFTPPPPLPADDEEDDDGDGPSLPMTPALA